MPDLVVLVVIPGFALEEQGLSVGGYFFLFFHSFYNRINILETSSRWPVFQIFIVIIVIIRGTPDWNDGLDSESSILDVHPTQPFRHRSSVTTNTTVFCS